MNDTTTMHIFQSKTNLYEPIKNLKLREVLFFCLLSLYVISKVADYYPRCELYELLTFTVFHYNDELIRCQEALLIFNDVWMV